VCTYSSKPKQVVRVLEVYTAGSSIDLHQPIYSIISPPSSPSSRPTPQHRQVVSRLYFNLGVDASPAIPCRRPRQIVFTNIVRGHHRRQPSTSPTSQHRRRRHRSWSTSNADKIFFFSY
jgi:hypothetical protein